MTEDQYIKLQELQEKLADACIIEADPDLWPGAGLKPNEMTQEERGDRYWCKKDAAATFTLLNKVITIGARDGLTPIGEGGEDASLDAAIKAAEKQGKSQLLKFQKRFDKASNG